jgi:dimethylaniline monooxygenase (N-oxide forming)
VRRQFSSTAGDEVKKKIGIIGGGVAGLQMARSCKVHGFDVVVFDKGSDVGGVWRENYHSLELQVPKELFEFPGYPDDFIQRGVHSTRAEVHDYCCRFAEYFKLTPLVKLNAKVESLTRRPDGKAGWVLHVLEPQQRKTRVSVDYAVVATGMYNLPWLPTFEGAGDFKGSVIHASNFLDRDTLAGGKKVVVVGSGKSAADIVCECSSVAYQTTLLYRRAHWGTPRNIAGLVPFKCVFANRQISASNQLSDLVSLVPARAGSFSCRGSGSSW